MSDSKRTARDVMAALRAVARPEKAAILRSFFKTGPGQYGEGDVFLGVTVPEQRTIARHHRDLPADEVERLLRAPEHEARLTSLLILVDQFERGDTPRRRAIYELYVRHMARVNNWDLVDLSADRIVGAWLLDRADGRRTLRRLARSASVWERRIAMLSTFHAIKRGSHDDAIAIAELLLHDDHDLIHKAVGWMLREVGKRASAEALAAFLDRHAGVMPRTMLRYAIERLPDAQRRHYMGARSART